MHKSRAYDVGAKCLSIFLLFCGALLLLLNLFGALGAVYTLLIQNSYGNTYN